MFSSNWHVLKNSWLWSRVNSLALYLTLATATAAALYFTHPALLTFTSTKDGESVCKGEEERKSRRGLVNLGNTCYINSVLQGLYSIPTFRHNLLTATHVKKKTIGLELKSLFQKMTTTTSPSVDPYRLLAAMDIDVTMQEDAEEYLLRLLNAVKESFDNTTLISPPTTVFEFKTLQRMRCVDHIAGSCNEQSLDNFDLSIDLKGCTTLEEALDRHFSGELLSEENRYHCSKHGLQSAEKTLCIASYPQVFIIHLKRFSFDPHTMLTKKIGHELVVPLELDMAKYGTEKVQEDLEITANYELTAVVVHVGNILGGHYYTMARVETADLNDNEDEEEDEEENSWVLLNDNQVLQQEEENVLGIASGYEAKSRRVGKYGIGESLRSSATGYILFYSRVEDSSD
eukprot:gene8099-8937_t